MVSNVSKHLVYTLVYYFVHTIWERRCFFFNNISITTNVTIINAATPNVIPIERPAEALESDEVVTSTYVVIVVIGQSGDRDNCAITFDKTLIGWINLAVVSARHL